MLPIVLIEGEFVLFVAFIFLHFVFHRHTTITKDGILYNANGLISYKNIASDRIKVSYDEVVQMEEELNQAKENYLDDCRKLEAATLEKRQIMQKITWFVII